MVGQRFVPLFARFSGFASPNQCRVFNRFGQPGGRIRSVSRVAKVQSQLIGIVDVAFAACAKSLSPKFLVSQFQRLVFLLKLLDDVGEGGELFVFGNQLFVFGMARSEKNVAFAI